MKTDFTPDEKKELLEGARVAAAGPENDEFWGRLADHFDSRREEAEHTVEPRQMKL